MMVVAEAITKKYGELTALNSLSFEVEQGCLFGFIGPDGAGKTSLFRILTSLILPDTGQARVNGLDVVADYRQVRQIVGYMPGRFSLYPDLSVAENLQFFATVFGTAIEENYELIRDIYVQIEPFKDRLAGRLSGGMKQKLALSCALIHKPKLLVLDEPTTGVDAVSRREFWELLMGLKAQGITILVSTPYMDEAALCDRVALIQKGNILASDTPGGLLKYYHGALFSVKSDSIYQLLNDLRDYPATRSVFPFGDDVHYASKTDVTDRESLRIYLQNRGHTNVNIEAIQPGIEDLFMDLMEKHA